MKFSEPQTGIEPATGYALTVELPGLRWQREGYDVKAMMCTGSYSATYTVRTTKSASVDWSLRFSLGRTCKLRLHIAISI